MKIAVKIFVLASVIALASCNKSFLDVNDNPNAVTDVPAKVLLPNTIVGMAFSNGNETGKAAALLMQYNAGITGNSQSYDTWILGSFDNSWSNEIYSNTINNLGIIIQKSQTRSRAYTGIAKLQLAYTYAMITDLWGDI